MTAAAACLLIGKATETLGTLLLAYVGVRVAYLEWFVGGRLQEADELPASENENAEHIEDAGIKGIKADLRKIVEHRRKQFGPREALCVGAGGILILLGCLIYLLGLIQEHYQPPCDHAAIGKAEYRTLALRGVSQNQNLPILSPKTAVQICCRPCENGGGLRVC